MKLFPNARRRKPGLYAYRTRKHLRRGIEWGYGGYSTNLPLRFRCHQGVCVHVNCTEKPWYDLKAGYWELRLPWWLGWHWLLRSLETIMIITLRPRYNWQKNPRRTKVGPVVQKMQRNTRNLRRLTGEPIYRSHALDYIIRTVAALLIVAGPLGWYLTK